MSATPLRAPQTLAHHSAARPGERCSAISIALSERSQSLVSWRLRVDAITTGGRARLGAVITAPPSSSRMGSRVVALASCPGAIAWDIFARPIAPYIANVGGYLRVESCEEAGELRLMPLDGSLVIAGDEEAGAYNHATEASGAVATVPIGARVRGWSLEAGAFPATCQIVSPIFGALDLVTVPAGAAFGDTPENLIGPATFTFGGAVASSWVSWRELG